MSLMLSDFQIFPPENGEQFEKICLDLYKAKFGDSIQRVGRQGQTQNGVDIHVLDKNIGIQCKKTSLNGKIKKKVLRDEVKKAINFSPRLKRFILATTCKRDAQIQEEARLISEEHEKKNLFSVEIHSWDEIKQFFDKYPEVYEDYYPTSKKSSVSIDISAVQSESRHQELNRIRDLINEGKPKTAFDLLEKFKDEKWNQLQNKEKYRVLTNMASAKIQMRQDKQAGELLISALKFNQEDEKANENCALAYLIRDDIENSKKYIEKTKKLNPLNIMAYNLEIQIKDKEDLSLDDIISAIPNNIKTKYQIAHLLSYISIKRKQYKTAKKWLSILCASGRKEKKWKDITSSAGYADMSLSLILAKQDVFSGRHVPDDLTNKIEEIINIYKKLTSEYNELKQFNPNWYLHYALALELKGEFEEAIFILKKSIDDFPQDNHHFKVELSRILGQTNEIKKSISTLEELLGFNCLDSSENDINLDSINIPESFHLLLILADLYFYNNQIEKAWNLLNQLKNITNLKKEDQLEINQYRIFRLINFGKTDEAEKALIPLFEEDKNNISNLILKSKIESAREIDFQKKGKNSENHRNRKNQYLKKAYHIFKDKQYNEKADQNSLYFESRERLKDIQQLFQEFFYAKMHEEAEPLLEEITNKNLNHPDIFKLLHIYFENGKNEKAIELAQDLFKKFPNRIESVNTLFLIYKRLGNNKKAIQYYEEFFKKNPNNDFIRIELAIAYIHSEDILKAKELLKRTFDLDQLSMGQISRLSFSYMKIGAIRKALEILYKCIKRNPRELELQSAYFSLITFLDHQNLYKAQSQNTASDTLKLEETKLDKSFLQPNKVEIDCYVQIKDIKNLEETGIIIEEDADIYTPDHESSKALLGKKKDEIILLGTKKYQIMEIKSKYIYKWQEIAKENEKRHPSKPFVKSFSVPKEVDAEKLSEIFKKEFFSNISQQQEALDKLFEFYNQGKATIGSIAKISGDHSIEIIGKLIASKKDKWVSAVPDWEDEKKTQELLDIKTNILIDLSSLITIHQLQIEKYIEASQFKLYICQSTIDSLIEYINKISLHSKDGLLTVGFDKKGNLRKSFVPVNIIKQDLNFWIKIKTWAENYCQIKPLSEKLILNRKERQQRETLFGKEFFDSLLAVDSNFILLCEDAILRKFAELEYSVSGIRLFDLIECLERQVIIDNIQAVKFKAHLVQLNQTYIPIDHNILFYLLKESDYSMSDLRFQRALYFLSPVSQLQGVVDLIASFLITICQTPSLLPHRKQVITKEVLDKVSSGRNESSKAIAMQVFHLVQIRTKLLPILQNEIHGYIIEWLKGKIY